MTRHRIALVSMLALMVIPMAASAGGWAMASFDQVPSEFEAGVTYDLQYTILQHGETPVDVGDSQVLIVDPAGSITAFDAVPLGQPGRYSVSITFPESGSWQWEVTMGEFAPHPMGSIDVREASNKSTGAESLARSMLPVALLLVFGLIAIQVIEMGKERRIATRGQGRAAGAE